MDDPWKEYAKWKKPNTNDHILNVDIRQIHTDRKQICGCQGQGLGVVIANGHKVSFWGKKVS